MPAPPTPGRRRPKLQASRGFPTTEGLPVHGAATRVYLDTLPTHCAKGVMFDKFRPVVGWFSGFVNHGDPGCNDGLTPLKVYQ